jgi:hypothetical protein
MNLTVKKIIQIAAKHPHLKGADLCWDEPGRCIITLRDGITWDARDGNRHVEGFIFSTSHGDGEEIDTVEYFNGRLSMIEAEIETED